MRSSLPSKAPSRAEEGAPLLGFALAFRSEVLGVNLFGSPKEILDALRSTGVDYATLADHPQTIIDAHDVVKPSPDLSFRGGPHAEATLELIEATRHADLRAVLAVLEGDPEVLTSAHSGAAAPLLMAVSAGHPGIVHLLLEAGAEVDGDGEFDMTPLHWAAARGSETIVAKLLDAGADPGRKSWFYLTPGELAEINAHPALAQAIATRSGLVSRGISVTAILERMRSV